jgi:hypothetical protein
MDGAGDWSRRDAASSRKGGAVLEVLGAVLYPVRLVLFSVLALLEPVIRIALAGVALGGLFVWFLFDYLARAPHFPTATVLTLSAASAVALVVYYLLMRALRP